MSSNSVCNHTRDKQIGLVRFCYHSYDYRPNWTPLSPITITNQIGIIIKKLFEDLARHEVFSFFGVKAFIVAHGERKLSFSSSLSRFQNCQFSVPWRPHRQTDRQAERQTDRRTDRHTDRQTDRQTHTQTHRHTD